MRVNGKELRPAAHNERLRIAAMADQLAAVRKISKSDAAPDQAQSWAEEIKEHREEFDRLRNLVLKGPITHVYAAHDETHNDAVVLKEILLPDRRRSTRVSAVATTIMSCAAAPIGSSRNTSGAAPPG